MSLPKSHPSPINPIQEDIVSIPFQYPNLKAATELRDRQWRDRPDIPVWVDVSKVQLDRYFTRPEVAGLCHASLLDAMRADRADIDGCCFIEPSAGNGAFYGLLPADRRIGIDLVPTNPEYTISDYLSWNPTAGGRRYAVIGNPPFGYRGWLALAFVNHSAVFADYIGMILPMSFQSDGKGSPRNRVMGAELIRQEFLPNNAFVTDQGQPVKLNALWQVWRRGVNKRRTEKTCHSWIDLFTVDVRKERRCGHERLHEADWLLQRTFYGDPPQLVTELSEVKYGCGYGIVVKKGKRLIKRALSDADWRKYSNLAVHNCRHISMYHIRNALIDAGFSDA